MTSHTTAPVDPRATTTGARGVVLALAAATLLLLVVIAAAALSGDWEMTPPATSTSTATAEATPEDVEQPAIGPQQPPDAAPAMVSRIILVVVSVIGATIAAYVLYRLVRWARRTLVPWFLDRLRPAPAPGPQPALALAVVPLTALAEATTRAEGLLADGTPPTDAIIAAWLALEDAAVRSGATRAPAQTPTEFTLAVLSATPASPQAVTDLLALYHLARFSHTEMTPAHVTAAGAALRRLTDDFRRRAAPAREPDAETDTDAAAEAEAR